MLIFLHNISNLSQSNIDQEDSAQEYNLQTRIERYAGGSSCKILLEPDCNQGVTMPHNHTNKYSCHWLTQAIVLPK